MRAAKIAALIALTILALTYSVKVGLGVYHDEQPLERPAVPNNDGYQPPS